MKIEEFLETLSPADKSKVEAVTKFFSGKELAVVIRINSDMIEGRGPSVFHKVCDSYETARDYVSACEGIFGSAQHRSWLSVLDHIIVESWNGYDIVICPITTREMVPTPEENAEVEKISSILKREFPDLWKEALKTSKNNKVEAILRLKKLTGLLANG